MIGEKISPAKITVVADGPEVEVDAAEVISELLATALGTHTGDVVIDGVEVVRSGLGAWISVRIYAPVTTPEQRPGPDGLCARCRQPYSPRHDPSADGPTVAHQFEPIPKPVTRDGVNTRRSFVGGVDPERTPIRGALAPLDVDLGELRNSE